MREVYRRLWVGDGLDGTTALADGSHVVIAVHGGDSVCPATLFHHDLGRIGAPYSRSTLVIIAAQAEAFWACNQDVLIVCETARGLSCLAALWWMHTYHQMTLDEAQERVDSRVPGAQNVVDWIEPAQAPTTNGGE